MAFKGFLTLCWLITNLSFYMVGRAGDRYLEYACANSGLPADIQSYHSRDNRLFILLLGFTVELV